ncbi:Uncharacterized protein OBRU01_11354 [Operophtera brumata]|uniref:Uncharacterized protein n=1 Tax=Operophtera brumata TaxID=104452 RepID=A0A0L7LCY6_OPEBR|nr:Uncharacterized protein OBRU01_11354 [Operophtera brumata]
MTDAIASRNVTKSNATIEIERNMNITHGDIQNDEVQSNVACNCSKTIDSNQNAQIQCPNNNTAEASINCSNETIANTDNHLEKQNNETQNKPTDDNNNTMLKYLYKKNDTNNPGKSKGHYKNRLRRKRSLESQKAQTAPLIVNYETSHGSVKEREQWLPAKNTAHIIKGSDLADFNIETLHESVDGEKLQNNGHVHANDDDREHELSGEINERDINENKRDNSESTEEKEEINETKSQEKGDSNERESHSSTENSRENENQNNISNESERNDGRSSESTEHIIDNDDDDDKKNNDPKFTKYSSDSDEITENSQEINENTNGNLQNHKNTRDDSDEDKSQFHNDKHDGIHNIAPPKIQDIDLDDFSYERIQLNENGQVETAADSHGNKDVEIIPSKKPQPFAKTHDETNYVPNESSDSSSIEANEPTHINDGEVKPVVEINSEADSIESSEGNSSLNNESLETLTGVKEDSNEKYDKLQESRDTGDVKQQFERIPLDYRHKHKKDAKAKDSEQNKHSENEDDEAEEEDDDPYEKFVRERFGKRDTFAKRSEKIRDLGAHNPQLYKTVRNILDKTKNVKSEAAKSGDPNAAYMWTLEYGEKL